LASETLSTQCSTVTMYVQTCAKDCRDFTAEFEAAWDCYLPFVRRYGDALPVGFQRVPFFAERRVSAAFILAVVCAASRVDLFNKVAIDLYPTNFYKH